MIDTSKLKFAICKKCPGNMRIYPASALADHRIKIHEQGGQDSVICITCRKPFIISIPSKRCPKCRRNSGANRNKLTGKRTKQLVASGVEKKENIYQTYGVVR